MEIFLPPFKSHLPLFVSFFLLASLRLCANFPLSITLSAVKYILFFALISLTGSQLHAEIGATVQKSVARYGTPERDGMKESGLLYFRKGGLCVIAHFYQGRCDVLSIFSDKDSMGFPEELSDAQIASLLKSEGGAAEWTPAPRFTINGVWRTPDGGTLAIYDTMRHKLVIMTHNAYMREKKEKEKSLGGSSSPSTP